MTADHSPTATPTPPPTEGCADGSAVYVRDQQAGASGPSGALGDYYADMDIWNPVSGLKQHMAVCSKSSWYTTDFVPTNVDQGSVKAHPNVHKDYQDWEPGRSLGSTPSLRSPAPAPARHRRRNL
jgi:hypothetical protein